MYRLCRSLADAWKKDAGMADPGPRPSSPSEGGIYQALGFSLGSPFALSELPQAPGEGATDVQVRLARVPQSLPGGRLSEPGIEVAGQDCLIVAPSVRLLVSGGRRIDIEPARGTTEADVRPFLLGSALGVLCHQRGLLPLHASAVADTSGVVAFAGESGAGKSTLAADLGRLGRTVLCDDLCVVDVEDDRRPRVLGGVSRLKLRSDSLWLLGEDPARLEPVGAGVGKFGLPIAGTDASGRETPLGRIFLLRPPGEGPPGVRRLRGAEAAAAVFAQVYRWRTAAALGLAGRLLDQAARLARECLVDEVHGRRDESAPFERREAIVKALAREPVESSCPS
jgi:hypothetical protein